MSLGKNQGCFVIVQVRRTEDCPVRRDWTMTLRSAFPWSSSIARVGQMGHQPQQVALKPSHFCSPALALLLFQSQTARRVSGMVVKAAI